MSVIGDLKMTARALGGSQTVENGRGNGGLKVGKRLALGWIQVGGKREKIERRMRLNLKLCEQEFGCA